MIFMRFVKYTFLAFIFLVMTLFLALAGKIYYWIDEPVKMTQETTLIRFPKGSSIAKLTEEMMRQGVDVTPDLFTWYLSWKGFDKQLKAGAYELVRGDTPRQIIQKLIRGEVAKRKFTLVEGWTLKQLLGAIAQEPDIQATDLNTLKQHLNIPYESAEGLFFPETYLFMPGDQDIQVLRQAYERSQKILQEKWQNRDPQLPLKTPYEALILASIIEKESSLGSDRQRIAGVFINRLRKNMLLQTDPTVIYGMGDRYQGKIRKRDLQTDTPWNTYTRRGLPPTPIAMPSLASLEAVLHPEVHSFLYFVAKGDGTSVFASNLKEHQQNVRKYILKKD